MEFYFLFFCLSIQFFFCVCLLIIKKNNGKFKALCRLVTIFSFFVLFEIIEL